MAITAGIRMAVAPILFITADIAPTTMMTSKVSHTAFWPATSRSPLAMRYATPARTSPWLRINIATTVSTAGLANPANASAVLIKP